MFLLKPHSTKGEAELHILDVICALSFYFTKKSSPVGIERLFYLCIWHWCDSCRKTLHFWCSQFKKDINKLERVQRRAMRINKGLENVPDSDIQGAQSTLLNK